MSHAKPHLKRAISALGSQKALGDAIGETQQYVWNLLNRADSIKAEIAMKIAEVSGVPLQGLVDDFKSSSAEVDA